MQVEWQTIEAIAKVDAESCGERAAQTINSELIWLHWQVGARLRAEVLKDERAAYGEQLAAAVAASLTAEYGRGFGKRNLYQDLAAV